MKFYIFLTFCMLELLIDKGHGSFAPLTILTDKEESYYELWDLELIKEKNPSLPKDYRIMLCCPDKVQNQVSITVEEKCDNVESCERTCQYQYHPLMRQKKGPDTYGIGYEIWDNNKNNRHIWLDAITINFDIKPKIAMVGSQHDIIPKRHSSGKPTKCEDFSIGAQYLGELNMDQLYHQTNQDTILADVYVKLIDTTVQTNFEETSHNEYLIPHQLSPIDDFDDTSYRLATCSYFNTAPIWKSISHGSLKTVENFIRDVADHINGVVVLTGIHDVLQLPLKVASSTSTKPMYLDATGENIAIPKILYKMIVYVVPQVHHNSEPSYSGIFIVTHNQFKKPDHTERLCTTEDVCESNGWYVENTDIDTGITYCCEFTDDILDLLELKFLPNRNTLNLHKLPIDKNDEIQIEDIAVMLRGQYSTIHEN